MSDFPPQWSHVKDLPEGGQGHTFVVRRADAPDETLYVLKRLKNLKRRDYFDREIQVCKSLEHPNILKVIESGETPKGKPYLITEFCDGGSLADAIAPSTPLAGLRLFEQIVSGIAQVHAKEPAVAHLDLKPENILLRAGVPVVGDFGICFVDDNELSITKEGPRGSIYYCAPELRNPKIPERPLLKSADVYSLGKILYFIFTNDVYDITFLARNAKFGQNSVNHYRKSEIPRSWRNVATEIKHGEETGH
jgi:serine/threonine-protein kinase